jgi:hypothetical protein
MMVSSVSVVVVTVPMPVVILSTVAGPAVTVAVQGVLVPYGWVSHNPSLICALPAQQPDARVL